MTHARMNVQSPLLLIHTYSKPPTQPTYLPSYQKKKKKKISSALNEQNKTKSNSIFILKIAHRHIENVQMRNYNYLQVNYNVILILLGSKLHRLQCRQHQINLNSAKKTKSLTTNKCQMAIYNDCDFIFYAWCCCCHSTHFFRWAFYSFCFALLFWWWWWLLFLVHCRTFSACNILNKRRWARMNTYSWCLFTHTTYFQ